MDESLKSNIILGDRGTEEVVGKGTIIVKAKNGSTKYIQGFLYVLNLAQNLSSVDQLEQKGYIATFYDDKCLIFDERRSN